jgi:hypothetical protein
VRQVGAGGEVGRHHLQQQQQGVVVAHKVTTDKACRTVYITRGFDHWQPVQRCGRWHVG